MKKRMSINLKRFLLIPLVTITLLAIMMTFILHFVITDNFKKLYSQDSENFSLSYSRLVYQYKELETQLIDSMNDNLVSTARLVISQRDLLSNDYLAKVAETQSIHYIWWFSPEGEVLYDSTSEYIGWKPTPGDPIFNFITSGDDVYIEGIRPSTENDGLYYMVVYVRDLDGYFVETALDAEHVLDLIDKNSYQNIVQSIIDQTDYVEYAFIIDTNKDIIADTRHLDTNEEITSQYDSVFIGETISAEVFYPVINKKVFEVATPIIVDEEIIAILSVGYSRDLYTAIGREIGIGMLTVSFIMITAFVMLVIVQLGKPLSLFNKSITSFNPKTGDYIIPTNKYSVFNNVFKSLNELSLKIKNNNIETNMLNEEIQKMALTDYLTKLPNRMCLSQTIEQYIKNKKRFAVLFIDLDDFKNYNDTKGHIFGDKLLIEVAENFKNNINQSHFISRYGGDEFVILAEYSTSNYLDDLIEIIFNTINHSFTINNIDYNLNLSIGISIFPDHGKESTELLKKADIAMYEAKNNGKNQYTIYTEMMTETLESEINTISLIKTALKEDKFKILIQPQVDIYTEEIIGYEALARISGSDISPLKFIKVAEKNMLIDKISRVIVKKAIKALQQIINQGIEPKPLYINISASQFDDITFFDYIKEQLKKNNISPNLFGIEITEGMIINNENKANKILEELKSLGFNIAIDDFGTGQANLDYLMKYPIELVKLDRSYSVKYLNDEGKEIYDTIIKLASLLSFKVLAEGIEENRQIQHLKETECRYVQGFYYYKPMETEDLIKILKKQNSNK